MITKGIAKILQRYHKGITKGITKVLQNVLQRYYKRHYKRYYKGITKVLQQGTSKHILEIPIKHLCTTYL